MEYARLSLPPTSAGGVTAGIDWTSADHAACVVDAEGQVMAGFTVEHTATGLAELIRRLCKAGTREAAIERGDGPVADALLDAGMTVAVITPGQRKNLWSRYGSAGNKDDRFDSFVLADTLRTDRAQLRLLQPASPVSLAFLARFDCQDRADWLSVNRLAAWLKSHGYCGRKDPAELHARLTGAPRGAAGDDGAAQARITRSLLAVLTSLVEQIKALEAQIAEQLTLHADSHIFTSLTRAGTVCAARLLAEIGDCRACFPTPQSLICAAGVAPSTRKSGKHKAVTFRWAADKQLRDAVCDFAGDSRRASPWAARLYNDATARGKDHPHAVRVFARAWLYVIWPC